jgi:hypothetical protein
VRKCTACRKAKRACIYTGEEDICRRCRNRKNCLAEECVMEMAPERQRLQYRSSVGV